jgi:hypothetical protein
MGRTMDKRWIVSLNRWTPDSLEDAIQAIYYLDGLVTELREKCKEVESDEH